MKPNTGKCLSFHNYFCPNFQMNLIYLTENHDGLSDDENNRDLGLICLVTITACYRQTDGHSVAALDHI